MLKTSEYFQNYVTLQIEYVKNFTKGKIFYNRYDAEFNVYDEVSLLTKKLLTFIQIPQPESQIQS